MAPMDSIRTEAMVGVHTGKMMVMQLQQMMKTGEQQLCGCEKWLCHHRQVGTVLMMSLWCMQGTEYPGRDYWSGSVGNRCYAPTPSNMEALLSPPLPQI